MGLSSASGPTSCCADPSSEWHTLTRHVCLQARCAVLWAYIVRTVCVIRVFMRITMYIYVAVICIY